MIMAYSEFKVTIHIFLTSTLHGMRGQLPAQVASGPDEHCLGHFCIYNPFFTIRKQVASTPWRERLVFVS